MLISREQSSSSSAAAAVVDDESLRLGGGSETVLPPTMSEVPEGMTRTQWKKQLRQQRRVLKWERNKWVELSMGTYMHTFVIVACGYWTIDTSACILCVGEA